MDLVNQLLYDGLLLLQHPSQLLHLVPLRLYVEMVRLVTHERLRALLTTALLSLQTLLLPVSAEQTLLEEALPCLVTTSLSLEISRTALSLHL
jgi:hypothetical protein